MFEPSALVLLFSTKTWHQVFWENREWINLSLGKKDMLVHRHFSRQRVWLTDGSSLVHCWSLLVSRSHSFVPERSCSWARDAVAGAEGDVRRGSGERSLRLNLQPGSVGQGWNCWQSWKGGGHVPKRAQGLKCDSSTNEHKWWVLSRAICVCLHVCMCVSLSIPTHQLLPVPHSQVSSSDLLSIWIYHTMRVHE